MTGHALVIGNGFVINHGALGGVRDGNNDAARTFSVRRALDVMSRGGFGEIGNRFHSHGRLRQ